VEHYIDASSSDDEQVESLICAAKKQGSYLDLPDANWPHFRDGRSSRMIFD